MGAHALNDKGKGKGKNKNGKGKGDKNGKDNQGKGNGNAYIPKAIMPSVGFTKTGARICIGFNLGKCLECSNGQACPRGLHVCSRPGCEEPHTALACRTFAVPS